ncbi:MAG: Hsp20/alpha crystallin family protein [Candidatus Binatia bacterium]
MTEQEVAVKHKQEVAGQEQTRPGHTYIPDVDICETPDSLWLWADLPGVDERSVEVHLANGVLSIEGRVSLQEYAELAPVYTEYNIGNFQRRFTVSTAVDVEHIKARMNNGVLELELPKSAQAKPRRITITTH